MSDIQVKVLAEQMKAPVSKLVLQLQSVGIEVSGEDDYINAEQAQLLLQRMGNTASEGEVKTTLGTKKLGLKRRRP